MPVSGALPEINELSATADPKIRTLLSELKTVVNELEGVQRPLKWYAPKIIATEETKTSTSFVTMTTPDEITGVVVPAGGLLRIAYSAQMAASVSGGAGRVGMFINNTQLPTVETASNAVNNFVRVQTAEWNATQGYMVSGGTTLATGMLLGFLQVELPAGTYAVSARYKATSGSVTAKERILRAEVIGV